LAAAAGAWLAATTAGAGFARSGFPANEVCTDIVDNDAGAGEFYVVAINSVVPTLYDDFLFDVTAKGEARSDLNTEIAIDSWSVAPNFRRGGTGSILAYEAFVTYPRIAGARGGRLVVDSDQGGNTIWGAERIQGVGDSLLVGQDAGIGLVLPGNRQSYLATVRGTPTRFPAAVARDHVTIAFAPIAEVTRTEIVPGTECYAGGAVPNPLAPLRGLLVGYAVYRIPDTPVGTGGSDEFLAALVDGDPDTGYVGFVDLRAFDLALGRTDPANDLDPDDGARLVNPDGRMFSGDEVLIYEDDAIGRCAACGSAPDSSRNYWYAVQPVAAGRLDDFANAGFTTNLYHLGDHRIDLDGDGTLDAVSLNSIPGAHDTPEFISPQVVEGLDGLGLTAAGLPLLSAPMWHGRFRRLIGYELDPIAPPVNVPPLTTRGR
jgi:hypothetical protein